MKKKQNIYEKFFEQKKKNKAIKEIVFRDIRNLFENQEEENYYKPVAVSNKYVKYKRNSDRNKRMS